MGSTAQRIVAVAKASQPTNASTPALTDDDSLLELCERGHWFLKHRKQGDVPRRRFVYTQGSMVCWSSRAEGGLRQGKVGRMSATEGSGLLVVPGAGTLVFANKRRLHDKFNLLFSLVGPSRTLDLEAESEAERHLGCVRSARS